MTIVRRKDRFAVKIWSASKRDYVWVGTYATFEEALMAEGAVRAGLPAPPTSRSRPNAEWLEGTVVYFITAPELALVKIGVTADLPQRFAELSTAAPVELQLWATVPGSQALEREFHRRFALYRVRGEWFRIAGDLADYLTETRHSSPRQWRGLEGPAGGDEP